MDFDDTPEEAAFRAEARTWLAANAVAKGDSGDFSTGYFSGEMTTAAYVERCRWWQGCLHAAGWAGISWPRQFGGRGAKPIEEAIFAEEQARFGVSVGAFAVAIGMVGPTLMQHGTPDQQARWLAPMLRGEEVWCQLFSEPEAGSDLASLRTRAVRDGGEFVVDGQKVWTSNAQHSEWGILLARTDPASGAHAGITAFAVRMDGPGVDVRPLRQLNGEAHFNEVFLDGVRIAADQVLGEVDEGWKVARATLSNERVAIAGGSGVSDPERLRALARELGVHHDAVFRQRFAQIHISNELLRYLKLRTRTAMSKGARPGPEASIMKLSYSRYVKALGDLALSMQGARGQLEHPDASADGVWQQKFLNAVQTSIGGGTDEIQRNIIGERVLGLPRDAR
ncbi:MAG: acyl-CoA dehydrogenase family protein [Actinomycetota bacterium]|nr:acyl-CoA dehydrogenase family protein [Acidimicrobiia bacterium]MDQ3294624.1 acyl-CoA dehydrogenase family protein [Actinomycetota bacterium]